MNFNLKFLKTFSFWSYFGFVFLVFLFCLFACTNAQRQVQSDQKVTISAGMVKQTSDGEKTADRLFDGDIKTPWFTGWNKAYYPQRCVIDFGKPLPISRIRLYDGTGTPQVRIFGMEAEVDPGEALAVLRLEQYERWREVSVNPSKKAFRFLAIMLDDAQGDRQLTEAEIYTWEGGTIPPPDTTTTPPVGYKDKFWPVGYKFKYKLTAANSQQSAMFRQACDEWQKVANVTFTQVTTGDADIRVTFNAGGGAWSYVGTDVRSIPQSTATMNLGWLSLDAYLHEINRAYFGPAARTPKPDNAYTLERSQRYTRPFRPP